MFSIMISVHLFKETNMKQFDIHDFFLKKLRPNPTQHYFLFFLSNEF